MSSSPIRVLFFCLGNICRSPLAEALFVYHVQEQGLQDHFEVDSAGTSSYHVGEPPDPGSIKVARERLGLDISGQRAQQLNRDHLRTYDYVVAMDGSNLANARGLDPDPGAQLLLFRDFEPNPTLRGSDVPDPWGGGTQQFEVVYEIVTRCSGALLEHIVAERGLG